jgi:hypothetical protein
VRPRALDAALDGLRRSFRVVVADVDPDVEGEAECGSLDIEERNALARTTLLNADVVVVVGLPGVKGLHSMLRVVRDLLAVGVDGSRLLPIVNRAPRSPRARAEITGALAQLVPETSLASPVYVGERRRLDDVARDGIRLPAALTQPVAGAVKALLERLPAAAPTAVDEPARITPGSLGGFADEESVGGPA